MQAVKDFEPAWHTGGPQEVEAALLFFLGRGSESNGGAVRKAWTELGKSAEEGEALWAGDSRELFLLMPYGEERLWLPTQSCQQVPNKRGMQPGSLSLPGSPPSLCTAAPLAKPSWKPGLQEPVGDHSLLGPE